MLGGHSAQGLLERFSLPRRAPSFPDVLGLLGTVVIILPSRKQGRDQACNTKDGHGGSLCPWWHFEPANKQILSHLPLHLLLGEINFLFPASWVKVFLLPTAESSVPSWWDIWITSLRTGAHIHLFRASDAPGAWIRLHNVSFSFVILSPFSCTYLPCH